MPWKNSDVCKVQLPRTQQKNALVPKTDSCHCGEDHQAFARICPIFEEETKIDQIKTKDRLPRLQDLRKLLRINPNPELIFSNAVSNTSNRTTSKYQSTSEQESLSESSEDNSTTIPSYGPGYNGQGKCKKNRSPPSPPLAIGWVGVKIPRK